jgi:hypothetical protein
VHGSSTLVTTNAPPGRSPSEISGVLTALSCPSDVSPACCRARNEYRRGKQGKRSGPSGAVPGTQMARLMRDDFLRGDNVEDHRKQQDSVDDRKSTQCCVYRPCRLNHCFHAFRLSRSFLCNWRRKTGAHAGERIEQNNVNQRERISASSALLRARRRESTTAAYRVQRAISRSAQAGEDEGLEGKM